MRAGSRAGVARAHRGGLAFVAGIAAAGCGAIFGIPETIDFGPAPTLEGGAPDTAATTGDAFDSDPIVPVAQARGCLGLEHTCGTKHDNCCASTVIPGGTFSLNYDGIAGDVFDNPAFSATVSPFRLDTYEVTVGRYRAFVAGYPTNLPKAGEGKNPNDPTDPGWDPAWTAIMPSDANALLRSLCDGPTTWTDTPRASSDTRPMTCVTWFEAFAFCVWDGGRLPTDAEWDYAAAGGSEQRAYPWSVPPMDLTIDGTYAIYGTLNVAPVGSAPAGAGRFGQLDLAGNVSEWVVDCALNLTEIKPPVPCVDCALRTASAQYCEFRGGSYRDADKETLRTSLRRALAPDRRQKSQGVRCARAVDPR